MESTDTMGAILTAALIVGSLYPWMDIYISIHKLLLPRLFGVTTWLSAIAPNIHTFLASRYQWSDDLLSRPLQLDRRLFCPGVRGNRCGHQPGIYDGLVLATTVAKHGGGTFSS
jgi:hypothetical protein